MVRIDWSISMDVALPTILPPEKVRTEFTNWSELTVSVSKFRGIVAFSGAVMLIDEFTNM